MSQVAVERVIRPMQRRFRRARMEQFLRLFDVTDATRILDVGGAPLNWTLADVRPQVTLLNTRASEMAESPPWIRTVIGDGRRIPAEPGEYDIVYSNSVIEHVGGYADQQRFAAEIERVGARYYVQTPNRWFVVEPHLVGAFVHYLPRDLQRPWLLRYGTVWGLVGKPTPAQCEQFKRETRLLTRGEMRVLFQHADTILAERMAGVAKSFIAIRGAGAH